MIARSSFVDRISRLKGFMNELEKSSCSVQSLPSIPKLFREELEPDLLKSKVREAIFDALLARKKCWQMMSLFHDIDYRLHCLKVVHKTNEEVDQVRRIVHDAHRQRLKFGAVLYNADGEASLKFEFEDHNKYLLNRYFVELDALLILGLVKTSQNGSSAPNDLDLYEREREDFDVSLRSIANDYPIDFDSWERASKLKPGDFESARRIIANAISMQDKIPKDIPYDLGSKSLPPADLVE